MLTQSSHHVSYRAEIILSVVFFIASLICFIVNYSIDRSFSWSLFPAGALFMIWATITPLMVLQKNKALGAFAAL